MQYFNMVLLFIFFHCIQLITHAVNWLLHMRRACNVICVENELPNFHAASKAYKVYIVYNIDIHAT